MIKNFKQRKKLNFTQMNKFIVVLGVLFVFILGIRYFHKLNYLTLSSNFYSVTGGIVTFVSSYFIASLYIRFTIGIFLKLFRYKDIEHKLLATKLYGFVVYVFTTVLLLWILGVNVQNITLFLGLITTGLAFALREVLLNYLVWFMFLTKKPFRIGDNIRIGEVEGKVEHIGTFYVVLDDSPDDKDDFVRVPNKIFMEKAIINYGKAPFFFSMTYPLHREMDPNKLEIVENIILSLKDKLKFDLIGDEGSVKIQISGKVSSYVERDEIRTKIMHILIQQLPFKS